MYFEILCVVSSVRRNEGGSEGKHSCKGEVSSTTLTIQGCSGSGTGVYGISESVLGGIVGQIVVANFCLIVYLIFIYLESKITSDSIPKFTLTLL